MKNSSKKGKRKGKSYAHGYLENHPPFKGELAETCSVFIAEKEERIRGRVNVRGKKG